MSTPSTSQFSSQPLSKDLLNNLEALGFHSMTDIQQASLPQILAGKDVIGQAKTGSGKTVAFGLGLLQKLNVERFRVQSLVLCPTRELADQVARELRKLARTIHNIKILTLCGGMPFGPQIGSLEHGAHIVVGTPGRIEEHIRKERLILDEVNMLVLDEADRMLEMGFQTTLDAIVEKLPAQRQTLLFSATFPDAIESLSERVLKSPVMVKVEAKHSTTSISQYFYTIKNKEARKEAVDQVLSHFAPTSAVVFCNTKRETAELADFLQDLGHSALAINGDMEQRERDQTLVRFANRSTTILVATDVAARGLDIDDLELVINYHIARDPEVHVHRIGRTGRAGAKGTAVSLLAENERHKLTFLEEALNDQFVLTPLPEGDKAPQRPEMVTIQIDGGKKQKVRPGDIVGALTGDGTIDKDMIGKIHVYDFSAYVAVARPVHRKAHEKLSKGKLKGKQFRARIIR